MSRCMASHPYCPCDMSYTSGPGSSRDQGAPTSQQPVRIPAEVLLEERPHFLPLPAPYVGRSIRTGATPHQQPKRASRYSIPHTHVRRALTVRADQHQVRILDGADVVAEHARSYDRGAQIEIATHIDALVEYKREAGHHRGLDHLAHVAPAVRTLMLHAAERGSNPGNITAQVLRQVERYGRRPTAGRDRGNPRERRRGAPEPGAPSTGAPADCPWSPSAHRHQVAETRVQQGQARDAAPARHLRPAHSGGRR
ncbi:hypothetical protein BN2476_630153 [Paraburkholderia piptadeniae]|uniref:Transposase for insertion sequence element IS21-like C-terminal domain-containing protein n=1 Tax=Paraburkholderia piptadeniae TaxID=1701573 RepID=A0A1N7SLW8_9BURK|nr:hypothetical protein BN2476_630153 [Paraburkholderia piptadeniae]